MEGGTGRVATGAGAMMATAVFGGGNAASLPAGMGASVLTEAASGDFGGIGATEATTGVAVVAVAVLAAGGAGEALARARVGAAGRTRKTVVTMAAQTTTAAPAIIQTSDWVDGPWPRLTAGPPPNPGEVPGAGSEVRILCAFLRASEMRLMRMAAIDLCLLRAVQCWGAGDKS